MIVNCSLFNPTPSLSAMIVHHFKMRPNVITYNLSGMGCSAGIISIGLAKELLQVCPSEGVPPLSEELGSEIECPGSQHYLHFPMQMVPQPPHYC